MVAGRAVGPRTKAGSGIWRKSDRPATAGVFLQQPAEGRAEGPGSILLGEIALDQSLGAGKVPGLQCRADRTATSDAPFRLGGGKSLRQLFLQGGDFCPGERNRANLLLFELLGAPDGAGASSAMIWIALERIACPCDQTSPASRRTQSIKSRLKCIVVRF